jgi:hypothetical protein
MFGSITWSGQFSVGDLVTTASILGAALAFFVRSWQSQGQELRQNTFQLLSRIFEPGPVGVSRIKMARWIAAGRELEDDIVDNESDDEVILSIIDFYEFLCEGAIRGVVDWRLVNQESGGRMERAYFVVRKYIEKRQERLSALNAKKGLGRVVLYKHLRLFLSRYRDVDTRL